MYRYSRHIVRPATSPRRTLSSACNDKRDSASHDREIRDKNRQKKIHVEFDDFVRKTSMKFAETRSFNHTFESRRHFEQTKSCFVNKKSQLESTSFHTFFARIAAFYLFTSTIILPSAKHKRREFSNVEDSSNTKLRNSFLCARNSFDKQSAFSVFILETLGDERFLRNISYKTTLVPAVLVQCWWIDAKVFAPLERPSIFRIISTIPISPSIPTATYFSARKISALSLSERNYFYDGVIVSFPASSNFKLFRIYRKYPLSRINTLLRLFFR